MTDYIATTTVPTPVGPLSLLVHDEALVAAGFTPAEEQYTRLRTTTPLREVNVIGEFTRALTSYVEGDVAAIDTLPVEQPGGPFRQAAWKLMREVPAGETITYAELASRVGSPRAVRAAGSACAMNLIAPVVPCHRIVRTGGSLGGYYYGLPVKDWLLAHEQASTIG